MISSDFETFLQMLTAQAQYQDPLDPVSSSDYAAQLAQFSMVEQQVLTNDQLGALTSALGGSPIASVAQWIGMEGRAPVAIQFDGTPVTVMPSVPQTADRAELVAFNDFGSEVSRTTIPVSSDPYLWLGKDQSGNTLGSGPYSFVVEGYQGEDLISSQPAEVYARIVEAQVQNGQTLLKFDSGSQIQSDQVSALRQLP